MTKSVATFAAGCFWGVEKVFRRSFSPADGLLDVKVGYTGGTTKNPSYRFVCQEFDKHVEAIRLEYDAEKLPYRKLLDLFFRMHDPTTQSSQGPDHGYRYSSIIFAHSADQRAQAEAAIKQVGLAKWWGDAPIVTAVLDAAEWWDGEEYHQQYLDKIPDGYECPTHFVRSFPPLER